MSDDAPALNLAYDPYGFCSPGQAQTLLGFHGQAWQPLVGLYLLGNGYRAYSPTFRRFFSPDSWSPFGGGGLNSYGYCGCDPVNYKDPSGHMRGRQMYRGGYRNRLNSTGSSSGSSSRSPSPGNRELRPTSPRARHEPIVGSRSTGRSSPPNGMDLVSQTGGEQGSSAAFGALRRSENFGGASTNLVSAVNASMEAAANSGSGRALRNPLAYEASREAQRTLDSQILQSMAENTGLPVDVEIYLRFNSPDIRLGVPSNVRDPRRYNAMRLDELKRRP